MLVHRENRVFRVVQELAAADVAAFLSTPCAQSMLADGHLPRTSILGPGQTPPDLEGAGKLFLEHERIPFPSFPYEWPAEMLHCAAALTLELAERVLDNGFGLKDATPYNVLFRGPDPVFVDLLSFERRNAGDPTWLPYAQFVRTFLLPLACSKQYGFPLSQVFLSKRDGLEPEEVYRLLKPLDRLRPPFLTLASLPRWLGRTLHGGDSNLYRRRALDNHEKARFILRSLFRGLRRGLRHSAPAARMSSAWSSYTQDGHNYSTAQLAAKQAFVEEALKEHGPRRVLDVGCNTGHFSALAAAAGASVVALDQDTVVVGATWRMARSRRLDILPLVVDLCRPSPATGWRNMECASFLDRARGAFDAVFMLAVLHHMLVTERVPLEWIVDLASEITTGLLVIEFVPPDDPMFRRITRGRGELHLDLTIETFESACRSRFDIVLRRRIEGSGRWMYLLRKPGQARTLVGSVPVPQR